MRWSSDSRPTTLLLAALLCLAARATPAPGAKPGGSLQGIVTDKITRAPLEGAHVWIEGTSLGTATDASGRFLLTGAVPASGTLRITMLGYRAKNIEYSAGEPKPLTIALRPVVLDMGRVLVFSAPREEEAPGLAWGREASPNTEEALASLEGVDLLRRGAFGQEPVLRGLSGGRVTMLVDGMRVFGACTDRMDPATSYVDLDALGRASIHQGAFAPQHGGAIGGTVALEHRKPAFAGSPALSYGFGSGYRWGENAGKLQGRLAWSAPGDAVQLQGVYRKAEDYRAPDGVVNFSGYEKLNGSLVWLHRAGRGQRVALELLSDDAWNIGYAALPMDVGYARFRSASLAWSGSRIARRVPGARVMVYHNRVDHWMDDSKRRDLLMGMRMDMPGRTRTTGVTSALRFLPGGDWTGTAGFEAFSTSFFADMTMYPAGGAPMYLVTWPDVLTTSLAPTLALRGVLGPLNAALSLRYELHASEARDPQGVRQLETEHPRVDPRRRDSLPGASLSLAWNLLPGWTSTIAYAYGTRPPTVTEAYGYYLYDASDGYLYVGNPALRPERSHQVEWRNRFHAGRATLEVTAYHYLIRDAVYGAVSESGVPLPFAAGWKHYENAAEATLDGVELSALVPVGSGLAFYGGLNAQVGVLRDEQDYLPMMPPPEGHAALRWRHGKSVSEVRLRGALAQRRNSSLAREQETAAWAVLGLSHGAALVEGVTLSLAVDNLADTRYREHLDWGLTPRPGRTWSVALRLDR
ncbi:MAG TPA: TonB-dependent receptor [Bacteroidetes bacterium]|nr:TonB-dependent receptor [Bacteroidota bacterium]